MVLPEAIQWKRIPVSVKGAACVALQSVATRPNEIAAKCVVKVLGAIGAPRIEPSFVPAISGRPLRQQCQTSMIHALSSLPNLRGCESRRI